MKGTVTLFGKKTIRKTESCLHISMCAMVGVSWLSDHRRAVRKTQNVPNTATLPGRNSRRKPQSGLYR